MLSFINVVFLFVTSCCIVPILNAQTINCTDFSISEVYQDSINSNDYQFSIYSSYGPFEAVNYPHVSAVLDCNGDTVATGGMFWFGQLGETIQDYPVSITGVGSIACYPLTAIFIYGIDSGDADTCYLSYNLSGLPPSLTDVLADNIYPNPTERFIQLGDIQNTSFRILNPSGQVELLGKYDGLIDVGTLKSGTYFLELKSQSSMKILRFNWL
jgi:hypothetical protein